MQLLRLQKFLARAGVASRRASEDIIVAGRVTVNGEVVNELGSKVNPNSDTVAVDGRVVTLRGEHVTIMLNKPAGVVTTMKAQPLTISKAEKKPSTRQVSIQEAKAGTKQGAKQNAKIVADLVPIDRYPGLYPIGRLDADTTGLLLFSTDGELGNRLLHPSHHVPKTYVAHVQGRLTRAQLQQLRAGVELDDGPTQPAEVELVGDAVRITIHEGRYHQVKRMFEAVGHPVRSLHRERFGLLSLGDLPEGSWRKLTSEEVALLC